MPGGGVVVHMALGSVGIFIPDCVEEWRERGIGPGLAGKGLCGLIEAIPGSAFVLVVLKCPIGGGFRQNLRDHVL